MALDPVPTYPGQYDSNSANNNPPGSDSRKQGDDQIRIMKANEKETWTNVTGAVTASHSEINTLVGIDTGQSLESRFFPTGTQMAFFQDISPPGWTLITTTDELSLRITKGSAAGGITGGTAGGSYDFGNVFTTLAEGATPGVGNHVLTVAELASHSHAGYTITACGAGSQIGLNAGSCSNGSHPDQGANTGSAGSDTGHSHTLDLSVKWGAFILCQKQ